MSRNLVINLRYALRGLRRNPLFTVVAVLSLALGLGANTAIFGLLDQVLIRPLAGVTDTGRLVLLDSPGTNRGAIRGEFAFSYPMYRDIRDRNQVFSGVLAQVRHGPLISAFFEPGMRASSVRAMAASAHRDVV